MHNESEEDSSDSFPTSSSASNSHRQRRHERRRRRNSLQPAHGSLSRHDVAVPEHRRHSYNPGPKRRISMEPSIPRRFERRATAEPLNLNLSSFSSVTRPGLSMAEAIQRLGDVGMEHGNGTGLECVTTSDLMDGPARRISMELHVPLDTVEQLEHFAEEDPSIQHLSMAEKVQRLTMAEALQRSFDDRGQRRYSNVSRRRSGVVSRRGSASSRQGRRISLEPNSGSRKRRRRSHIGTMGTSMAEASQTLMDELQDPDNDVMEHSEREPMERAENCSQSEHSHHSLVPPPPYHPMGAQRRTSEKMPRRGSFVTRFQPPNANALPPPQRHLQQPPEETVPLGRRRISLASAAATSAPQRQSLKPPPIAMITTTTLHDDDMSVNSVGQGSTTGGMGRMGAVGRGRRYMMESPLVPPPSRGAALGEEDTFAGNSVSRSGRERIMASSAASRVAHGSRRISIGGALEGQFDD